MNDDIRMEDAIEELIGDLERERPQGWAETLPPCDMVGKTKGN